MPTFKSYLTGFIISIVLSLAAYFAVVNRMFGSSQLIILIIVLALVQVIVQLVFFLHLGKGPDGRWNLGVLFSTIGIVFILVVGSIWIMNHLNYNMSPDQMNSYMLNSEGMMK